MSLKKKLTLTLSFLLLILISIPSNAATIRVGDIESDNSNDEEIAAATTFTGKLKQQDKYFFSEEGYEKLKALRFFDQNFDRIHKAGSFTPQHVEQLLKDLASSSPNIRDQALVFLDHHIKTLMRDSLFRSSKVSDLSEQIYSSRENYIIFLSVLSSLLKNNLTDAINPEFGFNIIDGLYTENERIIYLSSKILTQYGKLLTEQHLLEPSHLIRFVSMLKEIPKENHDAYLQVFKSNFLIWTKTGTLLKKNDVQKILIFSSNFSPALLEDLYNFIVQPEIIKGLEFIQVFDREWAIRLKTSITGTKADHEKQTALNLLAYLIHPFVNNKAFFKEDFQEVWSTIENSLEGYIDPFLIIRRNFKNLSQYGWFTRKDYDRLLSDYNKRGARGRQLILDFIDYQYDWLRLKGWLSTTPLANALFDNKADSKELTIQKLKFISKHNDLVTQRHLFTPEQIHSFFLYLDSKDPDIFEPAIHILQTGFSAWAKSEGLTEKLIMDQLNSLNPLSSRSHRFLNILTKNYNQAPQFYSKDLIYKLSEFVKSTQPSVADPMIEFFSNNYDILRDDKKITSKTKSNLKGYGILPKKQRRLLKRSK